MTPPPGIKNLLQKPVRGRTTPLSRAEKQQAQQVAIRLRDELRGLVELLPPADRGASSLAKKLHLDRATCQRIVATLGEPTPDARTLINLPGIEGLRLFAEAVARRPKAAPSDKQLVDSASTAIDSLEHLLEVLKVSQRGLRRLLEDHAVQPVASAKSEDDWLGQDDQAARATLFNAAAHVVGRWTDTLLGVSFIKPVTGSPKLTESIQFRAHLGHRARRNSAPLELGSRAQVRDEAKTTFTTLDAQQPGQSGPWGALAVPFCSKPLPRVTTRRQGGSVTHVVEADDERPDTPFDVVIANRTGTPEPHPATLSPAVGEVSSIVRYPCRRMVHDVFLHRDIARRCIPALETHLWTPSDGRLMARWSTRIPGGPKLHMLGQGLSNAHTSYWDRYRELLTYGFDHAGWNPDEFIGYRCEIEFPLWRCSYHFLFDFTGNEMA